MKLRRTLDKTFQSVESRPLTFPLAFLHRQVRFARVKKFPLLVLFIANDDILEILAVVHAASDPDAWRDLSQSSDG